MRKMLFAIALLVASILAPSAPHAQILILSSCGTVPGSVATLTPGNTGMTFIDTTGKLCVNASVSASITGFSAASQGTPIAVTTSAVTGTLPAGAVVVATNVGATNGAYCSLGASADTGAQYIAPNGGWFAFTVGASTQLTCITSTSTTTVNMVGGTGLPTGTGGGGGGSGGGGGAVTNAGTFAVQLTGATNNINNVAGTISLPTGAATAANQSTEISSLATIATNTGAAIPAGSAVIGKVGIDQTSNGTTNGVVNLAATSGGLSRNYATLANSTNATVVKNGAGQLYNIQAFNNSATIAYVKFYNKATTPTCNSDTVVDKYMIPASTSGAGLSISVPLGDAYNAGISYCVTTGIADNDNTAVAASAYSVTVRYK